MENEAAVFLSHFTSLLGSISEIPESLISDAKVLP